MFEEKSSSQDNDCMLDRLTFLSVSGHEKKRRDHPMNDFLSCVCVKKKHHTDKCPRMAGTSHQEGPCVLM